MSTLLLKLNFEDKLDLSENILKSIFLDIKKEIKKNELFSKQEKIYMKYKIKSKNKIRIPK